MTTVDLILLMIIWAFIAFFLNLVLQRDLWEKINIFGKIVYGLVFLPLIIIKQIRKICIFLFFKKDK